MGLLAVACSCDSTRGPAGPADPGGAGGIATTIEVDPASAELLLSAPGNVVVLSVSSRDAAGRPIEGTGPAAFSSGDPAIAIVDAAGRVTAAGMGATDITATLTVGGITLSGTARVVVVDPPRAVELAFDAGPEASFAGLHLGPPIRVAARDSTGRTDIRFEGLVSIGLRSPSGAGTLLGSTHVQAVRGVATFPDLRVPEPGSGYALVATAPGLETAASAPFDVTPGGRIAFVSDRSGTPKIHVMNADGSGVEQITFGSAPDSRPSWSPDGRRIAFARSGASGSCGIWVANADGSGLSRLTSTCGDRTPAWSPDGGRIAFAHWTLESLATGIYVMNADGSGVTRLTESLLDEYPDWSPDGARIAFTRYSEHPVGDWIAQLHVMEADGSGIRRLTFTGSTTFAEGVSAWSPDGATLAFWSYGYGVALVSAYGGVPLTVYKGASGHFEAGVVDFYAAPDWSPDGRRLVFARGVWGARELVVANTTGGGPLQILSDGSPGEDTEPAWFGSKP